MTIVFFVLVFVCEVIGTISGFGSSVLIVPLAIAFVGNKNALALTGFLFIASSSIKLLLFRKSIDWRLLWKMGPVAVASTLIGAYLNSRSDSRWANLTMAIALIAFAVVSFVTKKKTQLEPSNRNLLIGGAASGFLTGFIGTGGAVRGATLAGFGLSKDVFVATSAAIDLGGDIGRTVVYLAEQYLERRYLWYIPLLLALAYAGNVAGKLILNRIPQRAFEKVVLLLILLTGAGMLYGSLSGKTLVR